MYTDRFHATVVIQLSLNDINYTFSVVFLSSSFLGLTVCNKGDAKTGLCDLDTGLPTKDETSETIVRNLYCLFPCT